MTVNVAIPIFNYLENDMDVCLTHSKYVKAINGKKKSVRIAKAGAYLKPIIAIARMMMVCIYHKVSEKKPFTPTVCEELVDSQNRVEPVTLNESNVFAYPESLGYGSSKLVKLNDN